jgi:hypothetical protein
VATFGLWSLKAYHSVGLNATHRRSLRPAMLTVSVQEYDADVRPVFAKAAE